MKMKTPPFDLYLGPRWYASSAGRDDVKFRHYKLGHVAGGSVVEVSLQGVPRMCA